MKMQTNQLKITYKTQVIQAYNTVREVNEWIYENQRIRLAPEDLIPQLNRVMETEEVLKAFEDLMGKTYSKIEEISKSMQSGLSRLSDAAGEMIKKNSETEIPQILRTDLINTYTKNLSLLNTAAKKFKPSKKDIKIPNSPYPKEQEEQLTNLEERMKELITGKKLATFSILLDYGLAQFRTLKAEYFKPRFFDSERRNKQEPRQYLNEIRRLYHEAKNRQDIMYRLGYGLSFVKIKGRRRKY